LEILYEPIKFGERDDQVFVEVHPDVYGKISDFEFYAMDKLRQYPLADQVDLERFQIAARLKNGVPTNITMVPLPGQLAKKISPPAPRPISQSLSQQEASLEPILLPGESRWKGEFTLQTASLRNKENAHQLVKKLRARGYASRMEIADIGNTGRWYRVMVGGFATREEAINFAVQFLKDENLESLVVKREP
jgi:cell division septation protein DedD